jgi:hypothetical protein
MADYTYKELMRMQSDAVRRVEDMQRRAREAAGIGDHRDDVEKKPADSVVKREPQHIPQPEGYLPRQETVTQPNQYDNRTNSFLDGIRNVFDKVDIDEDKALILSLVLLLSGERADEGLLTALIYMLT